MSISVRRQQRGRHRRLRPPSGPTNGKIADGDREVPRRIAAFSPKVSRSPGSRGAHGIRSAGPGGRSIVGCQHSGVADRINEQIKFRERWRPFCPSMLDTVGPQMLGSEHPAPFMTFTFEVAEGWKTASPKSSTKTAPRAPRC